MTAAERFNKDFAPLEKERRRYKRLGVSGCPLERMIVELGLTPSNLEEVLRPCGLKTSAFESAYGAMKRHRLLPKSRDWETWLARYLKKRRALGLK